MIDACAEVTRRLAEAHAAKCADLDHLLIGAAATDAGVRPLPNWVFRMNA